MKHLIFAILLVFTFGQDTEQFLHKLSKDKFGQEIIQTVQIGLKQKGEDGHQRLLDILQKIKNDVQYDQEEADKVFLERDASCSNNVQATGQQIQRAIERKTETSAQLPLKDELIEDRQKQNQEKDGEAQRIRDRIQQLTDARNQVKAKYEERRNVVLQQVAALKEAKQILIKSTSFLGMTSGNILSQINSESQYILKNTLKNNGFSHLSTILIEAAQDAVKGDQKTLNTVLETIDLLVEGLYQTQKQELVANDASEAAYLKEKARLEAGLTYLAGSIANMKANLQVLIQSRLELVNEVATFEQTASIKTSEQQDWIKTCQDDKRAYEQQQQYRLEQIDVVNKVIVLVGQSENAQLFAQIKIE